MRVIDVSRVPHFGTQVTVRHGKKALVTFADHVAKIKEGDSGWSFWRAAANRIADDHRIGGTFVEVHIHGIEAQLSWRENDGTGDSDKGSGGV